MFQRIPGWGDVYPPNRQYVLPCITEGAVMPFSQYRFAPFRRPLAGPYIIGARQPVLAVNTAAPIRVTQIGPPLSQEKDW